MDYFIDLKILPDPEFSAPQLMQALYSKLHRALVALESNDIGVSFPAASLTPRDIGNHLRLHGSRAALTRLMDRSWLTGVREHVTASHIACVPTGAEHYLVRRAQAKGSPERLRRRLSRRLGVTEQEAFARIPDHPADRLPFPFIEWRSSSTGQTFKLFIKQQKGTAEAAPGLFNAFGLSRDASIPWF